MAERERVGDILLELLRKNASRLKIVVRIRNRYSPYDIGYFVGPQPGLQETKRKIYLKELKELKGLQRGLIIVLFESFEVKYFSCFLTRENS